MTNRIKMRPVITASALVLVLLLGLGGAEYLLNLRAQNDAQCLLQAVRALKVGESTADDVRRVAGRFGNVDIPFAGYCDNLDSVQSIEVSSVTLDRLGRMMPALRWFGNSAWKASAQFGISQERLCFAQYAVSANPSSALAGTYFVLMLRPTTLDRTHVRMTSLMEQV
jgi:hypothetical protein